MRILNRGRVIALEQATLWQSPRKKTPLPSAGWWHARRDDEQRGGRTPTPAAQAPTAKGRTRTSKSAAEAEARLIMTQYLPQMPQIPQSFSADRTSAPPQEAAVPPAAAPSPPPTTALGASSPATPPHTLAPVGEADAINSGAAGECWFGAPGQQTAASNNEQAAGREGEREAGREEGGACDSQKLVMESHLELVMESQKLVMESAHALQRDTHSANVYCETDGAVLLAQDPRQEAVVQEDAALVPTPGPRLVGQPDDSGGGGEGGGGGGASGDASLDVRRAQAEDEALQVRPSSWAPDDTVSQQAAGGREVGSERERGGGEGDGGRVAASADMPAKQPACMGSEGGRHTAVISDVPPAEADNGGMHVAPVPGGGGGYQVQPAVQPVDRGAWREAMMRGMQSFRSLASLRWCVWRVCVCVCVCVCVRVCACACVRVCRRTHLACLDTGACASAT